MDQGLLFFEQLVEAGLVLLFFRLTDLPVQFGSPAFLPAVQEMVEGRL